MVMGDENIGGPTYQIHPVNTVPNCSSLGVCPKSNYFNFNQDFWKNILTSISPNKYIINLFHGSPAYLRERTYVMDNNLIKLI